MLWCVLTRFIPQSKEQLCGNDTHTAAKQTYSRQVSNKFEPQQQHGPPCIKRVI